MSKPGSSTQYGRAIDQRQGGEPATEQPRAMRALGDEALDVGEVDRAARRRRPVVDRQRRHVHRHAVGLEPQVEALQPGQSFHRRSSVDARAQNGSRSRWKRRASVGTSSGRQVPAADLRKTMRDEVEHEGVEAHPDVRGLDLDVLHQRAGLLAGVAPRHDAVLPAVEGGDRHALQRPGELAQLAPELGVGELHLAHPLVDPGDAHLRVSPLIGLPRVIDVADEPG